MEDNIHKKAQDLILILKEIEQLLITCGEKHWSSWISRDITAIEKYDSYGIIHLLSAYGGMGSFNDLLLCPTNGHRIADSQVIQINEKLNILRGKAYNLAKHIERKIQ